MQIQDYDLQPESLKLNEKQEKILLNPGRIVLIK
jgi:hypothetical protein